MDDREAYLKFLELAGEGDELACLKLLDKSPQIEAAIRDDYGSLLHFAARWNLPVLIDAGMQRGIPVDFTVDELGMQTTPLMNAAESGCLATVQRLLHHGADIHFGTGRSPTALLCAVQSGNTEIVELLLGLGADIHASYQPKRAKGRMNALSLVTRDSDMAKLLRARGVADLEPLEVKQERERERLEDEAYSALYDAGSEKNEAACIELLAKWPGLFQRDFIVGGVLHWAASEGLLRVIDYAIQAGVDVDTPNDSDDSPLDKAVCNQSIRSVERLLAQGADVNRGGGTQPTPLIHAVFENSAEMVELLLAHGADIHACYQRESGRTENALSIADDNDYHQIAARLRELGATLPDRSGDPPPPRTFRDDLFDVLSRQIGPVEKLGVHESMPFSAVSVSVHFIKPSEQHPFSTLFTCGLAQYPLGDDEEFAELMLKLPPQWQLYRGMIEDQPEQMAPVQWLRMCAHAISDANSSLGDGAALAATKRVPAGWPCHGFLLERSDLPEIAAADGRRIVVYFVRPIYESELRLADESGAKELVARLRKAEVSEIYDEHRKSVA